MNREDFLIEEKDLETFKSVCERLSGVEFESYGNNRAYVKYTYPNVLYYLGAIFARETTANLFRK